MTKQRFPVSGAGVGYRRAMGDDLLSLTAEKPDFIEVAPENWMELGGRFARSFEAHVEEYPLMCHGLSLSLGGPRPLDVEFVQKMKVFFDRYQVRGYSEHLSYCDDVGHLYDLMPIPFTEEAVHYVAARIRQTQDILERRIAIENVSYYAAPGAEMSEQAFVTAVLAEADCDLLLDVNNIFVNSINHRYDPEAFLKAMPAERIMYMHVAGHYVEAEDLVVDTHGADVVDPVWDLLQKAYALWGPIPTLLERDFNLPPIEELMTEVAQIRTYQTQAFQHKAGVKHGRISA